MCNTMNGSASASSTALLNLYSRACPLAKRTGSSGTCVMEAPVSPSRPGWIGKPFDVISLVHLVSLKRATWPSMLFRGDGRRNCCDSEYTKMAYIPLESYLVSHVRSG